MKKKLVLFKYIFKPIFFIRNLSLLALLIIVLFLLFRIRVLNPIWKRSYRAHYKIYRPNFLVCKIHHGNKKVFVIYKRCIFAKQVSVSFVLTIKLFGLKEHFFHSLFVSAFWMVFVYYTIIIIVLLVVCV